MFMEKIKLTHINAVLLVILLVAAGFVLRLIFFAQPSLPPQKLAKPDRPIRSTPVDTKPEPRIYDLNKLKIGNEPSNASDSVNMKPADIIKAKEWMDLDPSVKKSMIDELDANIANSKRALEINPDNTMAKRILLISEKRKKIEMENFEGKHSKGTNER